MPRQCRYFLQGECRYGNRCRFAHVGPDLGDSSRSYEEEDEYDDEPPAPLKSFGRQSSSKYKWESPSYQATVSPLRVSFDSRHNSSRSVSIGPSTPRSSTNSSLDESYSDEQYIETIVADVKEWKNCNMWVFSSYGFLKDEPSCFDFPDYSPEEMRLEAYRARDQNRFDQYVQQTVQLARQYRAVWDKLLNVERGSADYKELLKLVHSHADGRVVQYKSFSFTSFAPKTQTPSPNPRLGGFSFKLNTQNKPQTHTSPAPQQNREFTYSVEEQLSKEMLAAFRAPRFEMGRVPDLPPPKYLCAV